MMTRTAIDPEATATLLRTYDFIRSQLERRREYLASLLGANSLPASLHLSPSASHVLSRLDFAVQTLGRDRQDLNWRRSWFIRADSSASVLFDQWHDPPSISESYSLEEISRLLADHQHLTDIELVAVLEELAALSLHSPYIAARALEQLGVKNFASIMDRTMDRLARNLSSFGAASQSNATFAPPDQALPLRLLRGIGMVSANASYAGSATGFPAELQEYLMPANAGWEERENVMHLGLLLSASRFSPAFASAAGMFLLHKNNRAVTSAAISNHPLAGAGRAYPAGGGSHGAGSPYAPVLSSLGDIFKQASVSPQNALLLLEEMMAQGSSFIDVDTEFYHGMAPDEVIADVLESVVAEVGNSPKFREQAWSTFLNLLEWDLLRKDSFPARSPVWGEMASFASHYWQPLRNIATEITRPVLVNVVSSPPAMSILSLSAGSFAMGHLSDAIEVELDETLDDTARDRRISAHVDAVGDVYHHIFVAAAASSKSRQNKAMSTLMKGLDFLDRRVSKVLLLGGLTPGQRAAAIVVRFGARQAREHLSEQLSTNSRRGDVSPSAIFSEQILNRDKVRPGGEAPVPTWFEKELAVKILKHRPELAEDLQPAAWLTGNQLRLEDSAEFDSWFASAINADPPSEFSLVFSHLQREFAGDLLLDAVAAELQGALAKAEEALSVAKRTQAEWEQWSEENTPPQQPPASHR